MAGDSANARVWESFDVYKAPLGTAAPVDLTTAWAAAYVALGLGTEDGITLTRDQSVDQKYDWNGNLVRVVKGSLALTIAFTLIEDNDAVFKALNPGSTATTATGITTRVYKKPTTDISSFGIQTVDGAVTSRLYIPRGEVLVSGDEPRTRGELTTRAATLQVYPATDGTLYREITNAAGAVVVP
jgi:hypothetical protein